MEKYYHILGVEISATPREIRSKYLQLVKSNHPDVSGKNDLEFEKIVNSFEKIRHAPLLIHKTKLDLDKIDIFISYVNELAHNKKIDINEHKLIFEMLAIRVNKKYDKQAIDYVRLKLKHTNYQCLKTRSSLVTINYVITLFSFICLIAGFFSRHYFFAAIILCGVWFVLKGVYVLNNTSFRIKQKQYQEISEFFSMGFTNIRIQDYLKNIELKEYYGT